MNILCFDVGGTFIKTGIVDGEGRITIKDNFPTPLVNCRESIPDKISEYTNRIIDNFDIDCVGISTAGQVDSEQGIITYANENLPDFTGCRLADDVEKSTGLKTFAENDANCAAIGEMWMGAGKNADSFVCITLGTGVGGSIVLNRKLYKGPHNSAGEIGYLKIGNTCLDKCGSTIGLLKDYKTLTDHDVDGIELFELIKKGNKVALRVYNDFLNNLVDGILNTVYVIDPELIIIGGGISSQGKLFFNEVNRLFHKKSLAVHKSINIVKAELENSAGLTGAYYIASNRNYYF
ncbi:MAG TPA: ROK family protein [Victivallales bacterium]|nr:ROK family protein [Victivallales bacterium]